MMSQTTSASYIQLLNDLRSCDQGMQNRAFPALIKLTDQPVDWAYEIWDDLLHMLVDGDNRQRSIASQVLSNLAKSDPEQRMLKNLWNLLKVTKDERFVTARHCLQSLWKIGVAGEPQRKALLPELAARFRECTGEKNYTLVRYDILVVLRRIYDLACDEEIRAIAQQLIATENDVNYQRKYMTVWRK